MMIVFLRSFLVALAAWAALGAWASAPALALSAGPQRVDLSEHMSVARLRADEALDADALWEGGAGEAVPAQRVWRLAAGERMVGRVTLRGSRGRETHVIEVPAASVDEVRVWHREEGGAWRAAIAGDRVPLSRWPFASQYPAFPIAVGYAPVDVIVAVTNAGPLGVAVSILPDAEFRENQARSANLSGLVMGLGAMVTLVCLLGALSQRQRASWILAAVSGFALFTAACLNGYMAVWFTPEAAGFNNASKQFTGLVLAGLMVTLIAESLDSRYVGRAERALGLIAPVLCLALAIAQVLWLPESWRAGGTAVVAVLTTASCMALCGLSAIRGGRYVVLVAGGVACLTLVWIGALVFRDFTGGLDIRSALVGILLYATLLLIRQAQILRERYGRDVLGRAAVSAHRDPLTALLSYAGFELAYDEILLRQEAGARASSMMLFVLPGLASSGLEYGFVATERALVRFAAALQSALGNAWSIARLSETQFACISTQPYEESEVSAWATKVLARCSRISRPLAPVADFDLRIACLHRLMESDGLGRTLKALERATRTMEESKRIAIV